MAHKVKAHGGVLDGKRFLVHDSQRKFTHHAAPDGHYRIDGDVATWVPDKRPRKAAKASS